MSSLRRLWIPTSNESLLSAQAALLSRFVKKATLHCRQVELSDGNSINCVDTASDTDIATKTVANNRTLVLAHGLGSGLGFWFDNFDALAQQYDRVVAFDWLGFGASRYMSPMFSTHCTPL